MEGEAAWGEGALEGGHLLLQGFQAGLVLGLGGLQSFKPFLQGPDPVLQGLQAFLGPLEAGLQGLQAVLGLLGQARGFGEVL